MRQTNSWKLLLSILLGILIYIPSLTNYFSGDDWFLLRISRIENWQQVFNFFSFSQNEYSAAFYRPLSQQLYLGIFQGLFGLNALPFHLFTLVCFILTALLVYKIGIILKLNKTQALISVVIYMISCANFPRIYFVSAFQDVLFPLLGLGSIYLYLKGNYAGALAALVLSLLAKESAVTLVGIWFVLDWYIKNVEVKKYILPVVITLIYLWFRLTVFGRAVGDSYIWDFSIKKAANTLMWYGWWSIGVPEIVVDYVGSGFRILPKYFTELKLFSWGLIGSSVVTIVFLTLASILEFSKRKIEIRRIMALSMVFLLGLLSVLFLPWHKFSHHLGMPLAAFALIIGSLWKNGFKKYLLIGLAAFLVLNLQSQYLMYERHYSVTRAKISQKAATYFRENYPFFPYDSPFLIEKDRGLQDTVWGTSLQVAYSLSESEFFKVFYKDKKIEVYYEDLSKNIPDKVTKVSSKEFLR